MCLTNNSYRVVTVIAFLTTDLISVVAGGTAKHISFFVIFIASSRFCICLGHYTAITSMPLY